MAYDKLYDSGKMPRTEQVINELAEAIGEQWRIKIISHKPTWWGRSAADDENYEIIMRKIPSGMEVFWKEKGNPQYDFQKVVNEGRGAFDMKSALLSGPRAHIGKNGRYAIVPFTQNKSGSKVSPRNNDIAGNITKVGEYKSGGVTRNRYAPYTKNKGDTGKGGVYRTTQKTKNGGRQYGYVKFIMVSEKSQGWIYPAIPAGHYDEKMQMLADAQLQKLIKPGQPLHQAIESDLAEHFDEMFKNWK